MSYKLLFNFCCESNYLNNSNQTPIGKALSVHFCITIINIIIMHMKVVLFVHTE